MGHQAPEHQGGHPPAHGKETLPWCTFWFIFGTLFQIVLWDGFGDQFGEHFGASFGIPPMKMHGFGISAGCFSAFWGALFDAVARCNFQSVFDRVGDHFGTTFWPPPPPGLLNPYHSIVQGVWVLFIALFQLWARGVVFLIIVIHCSFHDCGHFVVSWMFPQLDWMIDAAF